MAIPLDYLLQRLLLVATSESCGSQYRCLAVLLSNPRQHFLVGDHPHFFYHLNLFLYSFILNDIDAVHPLAEEVWKQINANVKAYHTGLVTNLQEYSGKNLAVDE